MRGQCDVPAARGDLELAGTERVERELHPGLRVAAGLAAGDRSGCGRPSEGSAALLRSRARGRDRTRSRSRCSTSCSARERHRRPPRARRSTGSRIREHVQLAPHPGEEWLTTFLDRSTDVPEGAAPSRPRSTSPFRPLRQPHRRAGLVTCPSDAVTPERLEKSSRLYNFLVDGEVLLATSCSTASATASTSPERGGAGGGDPAGLPALPAAGRLPAGRSGSRTPAASAASASSASWRCPAVARRDRRAARAPSRGDRAGARPARRSPRPTPRLRLRRADDPHPRAAARADHRQAAPRGDDHRRGHRQRALRRSTASRCSPRRGRPTASSSTWATQPASHRCRPWRSTRREARRGRDPAQHRPAPLLGAPGRAAARARPTRRACAPRPRSRCRRASSSTVSSSSSTRRGSPRSTSRRSCSRSSCRRAARSPTCAPSPTWRTATRPRTW